jgi:transcriptional regulator with XRE-family HTH domain
MITPAQCRAGRALVDWSQQKLAAAAHIGRVTVRQFEAGRKARYVTRDAIRRALEEAGVIFIDENGDGPGVRLRKKSRPPEER